MQELKPNVYSIRAIDWDRRLFDELIPLPEGTTYNAYLVEGSEKTALLDTVAYATFVANALRPKTRFASIIGSFGWGGKMVEQLSGLLSNLKVELLTPVIAKSQPKDEDFLALDMLAEQIFTRHKEIRIA